ncbi:MAG: hypothetical protein ACKPKO_37580, partial [Candidatus Fonsibacter sp.]
IKAIEDTQLSVSRGGVGSPAGQSKQLAASAELRAALRRPMNRLGIAVDQATVYLGVGYVLGGVARRRKAATRDMTLVARLQKLKHLRRKGRHMKRGAAKVFHQGIKPSATYGVNWFGLRLRRLRS